MYDSAFPKGDDNRQQRGRQLLDVSSVWSPDKHWTRHSNLNQEEKTGHPGLDNRGCSASSSGSRGESMKRNQRKGLHMHCCWMCISDLQLSSAAAEYFPKYFPISPYMAVCLTDVKTHTHTHVVM